MKTQDLKTDVHEGTCLRDPSIPFLEDRLCYPQENRLPFLRLLSTQQLCTRSQARGGLCSRTQPVLPRPAAHTEGATRTRQRLDVRGRCAHQPYSLWPPFTLTPTTSPDAIHDHLDSAQRLTHCWCLVRNDRHSGFSV